MNKKLIILYFLVPQILFSQEPRKFVFGLGEKLSTKISTPKIKVYTSVGGLDEQKILDPWVEMNKFIEKLAPANILWDKHLYERQTHLSVFPVALTDGLKVLLNE